MTRPWTHNTLDRIASLMQSAELLADEACDAALFPLADATRLQASRLAIDVEECSARDLAFTQARQKRAKAKEALRRSVQRFCVEVEARLPYEESAQLVTTARLTLEPTARIRLEKLTQAQRAILGSVVADVEGALAELEEQERSCFDAAACCHVVRSRVVGRAHLLRCDLERLKAELMATLDANSEAARRVQRLVVRTRRSDAYFALKHASSSAR